MTLMNLAPKTPPGRRTRKARAFAAEIGALRAQGYTLDAIREALADVGVQVSRATVSREAARAMAGNATPAVSASRPLAGGVAPARSVGAIAPAAGLPSGKDIAEAFARSQSTNPLIRAKEHS